MPADKWDQYAVQPQNNGGADKWAQYASPVPAPAAEPPSLLRTMTNNFNAATQGAQPGDSGLKGFVGNIGQGGGQAIRGLANMIQHPLDSAHSEVDAVRAGPRAWLDSAHQEVDAARADPSRAVGNAIGQIGTGSILGEAGGAALKPIVGGVGKLASAARTAAIGDEDAAALRGIKVPNGKKVLPMQSSIQTARPYLQGASSLEDLQSRIPAAKDEVFQPYRDTLDAVGDNPVKGPDGMTTIRALEDERQELSAMNRGLKTGDPSALRLAEQKGLSQADSLAREKAIQSALDPALSQYGIDPQGIRQAYGSVARIGNQIEGRSTLLEKPQPSGLGKIGQISIKNPLQAPGHIISGMRDLVAGRPLFSMSPSDVGIREGFANAGPKPDFGRYTPPQLKGLLPASVESNGIPLSSYSDIFPDQIPQATRIKPKK